jgi:hypothetical protein
MVSLSRRGLALRGRRGTTNSPKGVLGGGDDRSNACDGGQLAPIFGDKKQANCSLETSFSFS